MKIIEIIASAIVAGLIIVVLWQFGNIDNPSSPPKDQTQVAIPQVRVIPMQPEIWKELYRLKAQYAQANTIEDKDVIKKFTLHEVKGVDQTKLPRDLQDFLKQL